MTELKKQQLISAITTVLEILLSDDDENVEFKTEIKTKSGKEPPTEMLTIREAAQTIKGLSEHTVRQLVAQGKVPSIRTGAGKNGKILVPKNELVKYLTGA